MSDADPVNRPQHYTLGDVECIDAIRASMTPEQFKGYLKGCALKYLWRFEHKENPQMDLAKAKAFIERLQKEAAQDGRR